MSGGGEVGEREILVFEAGGQRYGLHSADVRELVRAVAVVPLPTAPAVVEGLINVRGQIVPVLDIRRRFRLPPRGIQPTDHMIVALAGTRVVAIRADRAVDFVTVEIDRIEDVRTAVPGAEHVAGVVKLPDGLLLVHDLCTFLSEAEALTLDEALVAVPEGAM